MRFLRSPLGALSALIALGLVGCCVLTMVRVDRSTRPPRQAQVSVDFDSMHMRVAEVRFPSTDGLDLAGWVLSGDPRRGTVILCHDNGESKSSLVNLAIALRSRGFTLLLFDFRGHGESGDGRSTFGLHEKRDVLGAIDFMTQRNEAQARRIGIYGVGTGAHAAVLAAVDRPGVRVLVLDRLYPDVGFALAREVYADWRFGSRHLSFLPAGMLALVSGSIGSDQRAADRIGHLLGRDLLLLAPDGDADLGAAMRLMYERIPEQVDADGNLAFLPATHGDGLFGELQQRYHEQVKDFFSARLSDREDGPVGASEGDVVAVRVGAGGR